MLVKNQPSPEISYLYSRNFQDWLFAQGLLSRTDQTNGHEVGRLTPIERKLEEELVDNFGYLIDQNKLSKNIYSGVRFNQARLIQDVYGINKATDSGIKVYPYGVGMGVSKIDLSIKELEMAALMKSVDPLFVTRRRISEEIYGYFNVKTANLVQTVGSSLARKLQSTGSRLQQADFGRLGISFRVVDQEQIELNKSNPELDLLDHDYQYWLAELGLIHLEMDNLKPLETNYSGTIDEAICEVLAENYGTIMSPVEIQDQMTRYDHHLTIKQVINGVNHARAKVRGQRRINGFRRIGIGMGVKECLLAPKEWRLLARMFKDQNTPVAYSEISMQLFNKADRTALEHVPEVVLSVQDKLENSPVALGTNSYSRKQDSFLYLTSRYSIVN